MESFKYPELQHFWSILVFILGASFGSFGNVLIYRLPLRRSISKPASHCPHCEKPIAVYDNIPILSYLILRGRCRFCSGRISLQYPIVELITGLVFWGLFRKFSFSWEFPYCALFAFILIVHSFIDYKHFLLLDSLNLVGGAFGILFLFIFPKWEILDKGVGIVFGAGILLMVYLLIILLFKKEGMGLGDIKTAGMIGLYLGGMKIVLMFVIACVIGLIWGVIRLIAGKGRLLPFGSMMAIASLILIFWGEEIVKWLYF